MYATKKYVFVNQGIISRLPSTRVFRESGKSNNALDISVDKRRDHNETKKKVK